MNSEKIGLVLLLILAFLLSSSTAIAEKTCAIYFTGVGCPHCSKTDPAVLVELLQEKEDMIVIEYEIYQLKENAPLLYQYDSEYGTGLGIPLIILRDDLYMRGDAPILRNIGAIKEIRENDCLLMDGSSESFDDLDITSLPGKPKIWTNERILIKTNGGRGNELLKNLLISDNLSSAVEDAAYSVIGPEKVSLSGRYASFDNAIQVDGWIFQWNGEPIQTSKCPSCPMPGEWSECKEGKKTRTNYDCSAETDFQCSPYDEVSECDFIAGDIEQKLTLAKIVSLAVVDAINPCAIAVLTLMLIAILTYNPKKKSRVLYAGFAFISAVIVMYIIYGLIIIRFFQVVQALTAARIWFYKILGAAAILFGLLNIKDFIKYKPGGALTEMPLFMRPRMKKIVHGITSPKGAFGIGLFVTLFLLPCTIGPYVIAGGILSTLGLIATIPWLILYNIIFVIPMAIIVLVVYAGFAKVNDVSGWKEKNIRTLHLIAGIIMVALGLAMFMGWV